MIAIIIFTAIIFTANFNLAQQWQNLNFPQNKNINDVSFNEKEIAFVVGDSGMFLKTKDNGATWQSIDSKTASNLQSIFFIGQTGYLAGNSGKIIKFDNEGNILEDISVSHFFNINDIMFRNSLKGLAVGTKETFIDGAKYFLPSVLLTTNGGSYWKEIHFDYQGSLNAAAYIDDKIVFAVGDNGRFIKSTDGGYSWNLKSLNISLNLNDIEVLPDYNIVIAGDNGIILLSRDLGETWSSIPLPDYYHFNKISYKKNDCIFCAGTKEVRIDGVKYFMATIISFSLRQLSWHEEYSFKRGEYNSISFSCESEFALAVGNNGAAVSLGGRKEIKSTKKIITQSYNLQNYPNPFNPSTKISYTIPQATFVKIKLFNSLGEEISQLINEEKEPGRYEIDFNASGLSSGVYFCVIESGDLVETKKMLLLR